jgi:hypothetical protein
MNPEAYLGAYRNCRTRHRGARADFRFGLGAGRHGGGFHGFHGGWAYRSYGGYGGGYGRNWCFYHPYQCGM